MTSIIPDYLCEQDQWHVACSNAQTTAAPAAAIAQRDEYLERRQLGGFFQSIGGAIQSFFEPPPAPSPSPQKPDPPKPERTTTEAKPTTKAEKSSAAPATTLSPTTRTKTSAAASSKAASTSDRASSVSTSSDPTPITSSVLESIPTDSATSSIPAASDSALPASSPSSSSSPAPSSGISGGAIAGIVIGALALLGLLAALAVFLLRKKRKESNAEHLRALDGAGSGYGHGRADSMNESLVKPLPAAPMAAVAAAPMAIPRRPVGGAGAAAGYDEKKGAGVYRSDGHAGVELGTSFNMVELDSKEVPRPVVAELESPTTEAPPRANGTGRRCERDEMHF